MFGCGCCREEKEEEGEEHCDDGARLGWALSDCFCNAAQDVVGCIDVRLKELIKGCYGGGG